MSEIDLSKYEAVTVEQANADVPGVNNGKYYFLSNGEMMKIASVWPSWLDDKFTFYTNGALTPIKVDGSAVLYREIEATKREAVTIAESDEPLGSYNNPYVITPETLKAAALSGTASSELERLKAENESLKAKLAKRRQTEYQVKIPAYALSDPEGAMGYYVEQSYLQDPEKYLEDPLPLVEVTVEEAFNLQLIKQGVNLIVFWAGEYESAEFPRSKAVYGIEKVKEDHYYVTAGGMMNSTNAKYRLQVRPNTPAERLLYAKWLQACHYEDDEE